MVWSELKRCVARVAPRTKQELQDCILGFWSSEMTPEKCATYIDHVYKVAPVCVLMKGNATGNVPGKLFTERSRMIQNSCESQRSNSVTVTLTCAL